jgi:hypothetical protein
MMAHIGSARLGSRIVRIFMLTWGQGPLLVVFVDAQNRIFMVFYGFLHANFQFPESACKKTMAASDQINSSRLLARYWVSAGPLSRITDHNCQFSYLGVEATLANVL